MKTRASFLTIAASSVLFFQNFLSAELIWTEGSGWSATGDDVAAFKDVPDDAIKMMNDARAAQENGNTSIALSKYSKVAEKFPRTILAPEALFQSGQIMLSKNQLNSAFKSYNAIVRKYPDSSRFTEALHKEFELMKILGSGEHPKYFNTKIGLKDYKSTVNFYKSLVKNAPSSDIAPLALMHMGELALRDGNKEDAIESFEKIVEEYTYSEYAADAYFELGKIYSNLVKSPSYDPWSTKTSIGYFEDFLRLYPQDSRAGEATEILGKMRERMAEGRVAMGDFYFNSRYNSDAAIKMYKSAMELSPDSEIAKVANDKIKSISDGKLPKKTPVDFLFGRYKRPDDGLSQSSKSGIKSKKKTAAKKSVTTVAADKKDQSAVTKE